MTPRVRNECRENPLIRKHLWGFNLMGFMVFEDQKWVQFHVFRGYFFAVTFTLFNITQHMDLVTLFGDIEEMTINAATTLLFTTTVSRFYDFYKHRNEFIALIHELDFNIRALIKDNWPLERKIVQGHIRYGNKLTVFFWTVALITANSMNVNAMVEWAFADEEYQEKNMVPMILRSWLPVSRSWSNFPVYYTIHFYVMWVGMLIVPCWHAFMAALMIYVILELRILQTRLSKIHDYLPKTRTEEDVYQFLCICIKKQVSIKAFVTKLLLVIQRSVFIDFVIYSALICALLYHASFTTSAVMIYIIICYIATMSMILWMYHWHANLISVNSGELGMSLYMSDWHLMDLKCRRLILHFICYSNHPWTLKCGFLVMNIQTFLSIIRASYSYFTILNQMSN